jgi:hypothetical protein
VAEQRDRIARMYVREPMVVSRWSSAIAARFRYAQSATQNGHRVGILSFRFALHIDPLNVA